MKAYFANINKINEDVESFVIVKSKIENKLIEDEEIEKKMTIHDFLRYINLSSCIFVPYTKDQVYPIAFSIYKLEKDIAIPYSSSDDIGIDEFKIILEKINYDIKILIKVPQEDFLNGKMNNKSYFIINNEIYIYQ